MNRVRLGAVGYLNARPLVYGLERSSNFSLRFDVPSECASRLHQGQVDVGLIPSIEYLRGQGYRIVPGLAIASRGAVASVALYTTKPVADVRSIAADSSSRTSVALLRILCARAFHIDPRITVREPDLPTMLAGSDAALIIGDKALFQTAGAGGRPPVEKIDLGQVWTKTTGLPFVYAFWAGATHLTGVHLDELRQARDEGVLHGEDIAREYVPESRERQHIASRYLRDNIRYDFGPDERAGLELFFRYAADDGLVESAGTLRFYS